jgi:mono/diheme cytochrome c family protein
MRTALTPSRKEISRQAAKIAKLRRSFFAFLRENNIRVLAVAASILVAVGGVKAQQGGPAGSRAASESATAANPNQALINRYCVTCHNQRLKTANLALDTLTLAHPEQNAIVWERAIRKLRAGMMPPPGAPRPAGADAQALAAYLETTLDKADAANPNPGSVRIHRLNRAEYQNAMRDLFGLDVDVSTLLPNDDISEGFDNIASALKVSPSFLDQYIMAARAMAKQAVGTPVPEGETRVTVRGVDASIPLPPGARGGVTGTFLAPFDADYEIRATGTPAVFTVDGQTVDPNGRTHLTAGYHTAVMANAGRSLVESEGALFGFVPGGAGTGYASTGTSAPAANAGGGGRGGAGGVSVTINGPFNRKGAPVELPSRKAIFICSPTSRDAPRRDLPDGNDTGSPATAEESACASRIMATLSRKAFRRPVTDADLKPLMPFFASGRQAGTFENGIENAITAMLSSAKFLYRMEPPPATARPGTIYRLSDLELASRLSFFLWSSIPDEELLALAGKNTLSEPKTLEAQVRRMLADARAKTLTTNFAFQWLRVRDAAALEPDPYIYPAFDRPLRDAIRREMELFLDSVFRDDRNVTELLSANYTFLNERLAQHYGVPNVRGDQFRRVTLADPNRFGLLGKASVLMVTAYPNRTSPVLRGSYILENLLGTPPAPPPPNVEAFKENKEGERPKTIRQIMEQHRANPTCNACHGVMDPLGFALENFDTIGTYRAEDRFTRTKIDTSGTLVDGTPVNGPVDLRTALLAHPEQFVQTLTEKLTTYALGRSLAYYDMPSIRKIVRDAKATNYRFSSIVLGVVNAPAFRSSVVEELTN